MQSCDIVEKMRETGRRQVKPCFSTKTVIDYEPSGTLEFRVGSHSWYASRTDSRSYPVARY